MTVKQLLKVDNSPRTEITVENYGGYKFKTFHIDYQSKGNHDYGSIVDLSTRALLPEDILSRKVTFVSVNSATGELSVSCYENKE